MEETSLDAMNEPGLSGDEFDAFNDDTFGDAAADWDEDDHENLARLELEEHVDPKENVKDEPKEETKAPSTSAPSAPIKTLAEVEAEMLQAPSASRPFLHPAAVVPPLILPPRLLPPNVVPAHLPLIPPPMMHPQMRPGIPPNLALLQRQLAHQQLLRHQMHQHQMLQHQMQQHQMHQHRQDAFRGHSRDQHHRGFGPQQHQGRGDHRGSPRYNRNPYDDRNRETFGDDTVDDFEDELEQREQLRHHQPPQLIMPGQVHVRRVLTGNPDRDRRMEERQHSFFPEVNDGFDTHRDSFAGLMTARDRQWVINIQLQQLKCDNPFLDDYYFTVYTQKREQQERLRGMQQKSDEEGPQLLRGKETSNGVDGEYRPVQFENSLGKLQAMSVKAPRKMIDVVVAPHGSDTDSSVGDAQRDARNYKSTLLELERLYSTLIVVEDSEKKLMALPTNTPMRQQVLEEREQALLRLMHNLCREERLKRFWLVRKGKKLVRRCLRLMDEASLTVLWCSLFHCLAQAIKRDREESLLPDFIPDLQKFVFGIKQEDQMLSCIAHLNAGRRLKLVLASPFGVAVVQMLVLAAVQNFELQQHSAMKELAAGLTDGAKIVKPLSWDGDGKKIDSIAFKPLFQLN